MHRGYIKFWRKTRDNPRMHDPDYLSVWIWILLEANHKSKKEILGGKIIECHPGQFTTGRKQLCKISGVNRSKLERILKIMENEQQIEQQTTNTNRLISICNWGEYQQTEQQIEQQVSNNRATSEQQVSTPEECKNDKNVKNIRIIFIKPTVEEIKSYCDERNNNIDPNEFFDHYESNGWVIGKNKTPMKNWQASVRTWESNRKKQYQGNGVTGKKSYREHEKDQENYDYSDVPTYSFGK
jgi:hypothetical protein